MRLKADITVLKGTKSCAAIFRYRMFRLIADKGFRKLGNKWATRNIGQVQKRTKYFQDKIPGIL